ncbi:MAG: metallophosphoesterase family protein [Myxococcota bacterium]
MRIAHCSDFHFGKPPRDEVSSERAASWWLAEFQRREADVIVVSGDLIETPGDAERLREAHGMLEATSIPYVVVPGNHDVPEPGVDGPFESLFGGYPRVATVGGVEFVLVDSMRGIPVEHRSPEDVANHLENGAYSKGRVGIEQLAALDEMVAVEPAAPRVLVVHHHLRENAPTVVGYEDVPTAPEGLMGPLEDARGLLDWAQKRHVRLVFHGHKHNFWEPYEPREGVLVLNSGTSTRGKAGRERRARMVELDVDTGEVQVQALEFGG